MNMFLHELKFYRKSTIIWTLSLLSIVIVFLSMYPGFSKDVDGLKNLLESYPEQVRKAFGITLESFSTILGFYSYLFIYISLCGGIQAMNLGLSVISKETSDKTADFLLTKPVTRREIMTAKLLAILTSIIITNIIFISFSIIIAYFVSNTSFDIKIFIMISITMFFIQLIFLTLGILISTIVSKIKSVIAVSLSTVFGLFIISMLDSVIDSDVLKYLTPFKYFDLSYVTRNASYESPFIIIEIIFIITSLTISYYIYSKKDIHAV
ncbi:ABC transporter permease subunit [Clostridium cibarium]|uniref:ABC transporter permease subunit n=1 Tax=Clostridium cibarium TaxID=2762247 RepID=A0ABR8PUZ6_9CLOT|nr:ABC transporter permease subunit [Clostridium cibarium]MBD7911962.1 ABC transporter permease subunit [Clostridium cibarium]